MDERWEMQIVCSLGDGRKEVKKQVEVGRGGVKNKESTAKKAKCVPAHVLHCWTFCHGFFFSFFIIFKVSARP